MATAYATFGSRLANLTVSGVTRKLEAQPEVIVPGDLPVQWVQYVTGVEGGWTSGVQGGWPTLGAQLMIAVNALQLTTYKENYLATLTMMDNVSSALRGSTAYDPGGTNTAQLSKSALNWEIRYEFYPIGDTNYWTVVVDLTTAG